jgi:S-adenosylmethionine decarboxylase
MKDVMKTTVVYNQEDTHSESSDHIGRHLTADLWRCAELPDEIEPLETIMLNACHVAGATIIGVTSHKFEPQGVTVLVLLAESHISIHSWPEFNYAAIDIFTCGKEMQPQAAVDYLVDRLKPEKVEAHKLIRGKNYAKYSQPIT